MQPKVEIELGNDEDAPILTALSTIRNLVIKISFCQGMKGVLSDGYQI